jgi:hypothetical protein
MKAVVLTAAKEMLTMREIPDPQPGPGQVRIRLHATGGMLAMMRGEVLATVLFGVISEDGGNKYSRRSVPDKPSFHEMGWMARPTHSAFSSRRRSVSLDIPFNRTCQP